MQKMLLLINHLDMERHLSEIKEIVKTHEVAKTYLAKVSPDFGSRVRSIVAPHKLDMAARMSDAATGKYLSQIAGVLCEDGINCEIVSTSIPAKVLDDFIHKNNIGLVLTSDGRSGLCRWPGGGLVGGHAQFLHEHAFTDERVELARDERTKSGVKKMLVLLNRLDIEERLPELRDIIMTQGVERVYLASASRAVSSGSQSIAAVQELHPVERMVVYLARVSRGFGSRVRSRVSPQKLDMAARMGDASAGKYLLRVANALAAQGIEAIPIGVSIPADKIDEYIEKNDIGIIVTGDGRSGLCSWPSRTLPGRNWQSLYRYGVMEELAALERQKARYGIGTIIGSALQFSALFLFWLILSGNYEPKYILLGVASAALVTYLTNDLVFSSSNPDKEGSLLLTISQWRRFIAYIPPLFIKIVLANLQVAYLVLHPKMPISPALLRFQTRMRRSAAQVLLANSITLTPGTVTIDLKDGEYTVHALVPLSASQLITGQMQNRVGGIFGETREEPEPSWYLSVNEVEK